MSRSNPYQNTPSPAICRWEWKGGEGILQWYDKEAKENITEKLPFVFLMLDRTASVTGYSEPRESGMYSNEVKDTLTQPLIVKWQKKGLGTLAEGLWQDIKDKVKANSGKYAINCWVAFRDDGMLKIGVVKMSGCALGPWIEFEQEVGADLYKKAVVMTAGEQEGKAIKYHPPVFALKDAKPETDAEAKALDAELQKYFESYFSRPTAARTEAPAHEPEGEPSGEPGNAEPGEPEPTSEGDDVPF